MDVTVVDWIRLAWDRDQWQAGVHTAMNIRHLHCANSVLLNWAVVSLSGKSLLHGVSAVSWIASQMSVQFGRFCSRYCWPRNKTILCVWFPSSKCFFHKYKIAAWRVVRRSLEWTAREGRAAVILRPDPTLRTVSRSSNVLMTCQQ